jgi:hypothetical protein
MNQRADKEAKLAREEAIGQFVKPHTAMEERVIMYNVNDWPVLGDHKAFLARAMNSIVLSPRCEDLNSQGELFRLNKRGVLALTHCTVKTQQASLVKFTIAAVSNSLPTEVSELRHTHTPRFQHCKLCSSGELETFAHTCMCDSTLEQGLSLCEEALDIIDPTRHRSYDWFSLTHARNKHDIITRLQTHDIPTPNPLLATLSKCEWGRSLSARFTSSDLNRAFSAVPAERHITKVLLEKSLALTHLNDEDSRRILESSLSSPVALIPQGQHRDVMSSILAMLRIRRQSPIWDTELVCDWASLSPVMPRWISLAPNHLALGAQHLPQIVGSSDEVVPPKISSTFRLIVRLLGRNTSNLSALSTHISDTAKLLNDMGRPMELIVILPATDRSRIDSLGPGLHTCGHSSFGTLEIHGLCNSSAQGSISPNFLPCGLLKLPSSDDPIIRYRGKWFNRDPGLFHLPLAETDFLFHKSELVSCDQASSSWCRGEDLPTFFHWINPWCSSIDPITTPATRYRTRDVYSSRPRSNARVAGLLGVIPQDTQKHLTWLIPKTNSHTVFVPAPRDEVDAVVHELRLLLARGSLARWLSRCNEMENWWRLSQTEKNLQRVFLAAARKDASKKANEERKNRFAWQEKQASRTADQNSWDCPRDQSTRLRQIAPLNYSISAGDETIEETVALTLGNRAKASRIASKFIRWF